MGRRSAIAIALTLALLVALNVLLLLASPAWLESRWFAGPWPIWPALTARAHAAVPFSLTLSLLLGISLCLLVWALWRPPRWRRALLALFGLAALLALSFVPAWGAAYRRAELADKLDLAPGGAEVRVLSSALQGLAERVEADAPHAALAELAEPAALDEALAAAARCVREADSYVTGRPVAVPNRVRSLPPGSLLRGGYTGIALPWLLEPHVDGSLPSAARLATGIHELTHAAGWAREADTDALAMLAGLSCDHPWVRYATALHSVSLVGSSLRPLLSESSAERAALEALLAGLPDAAHADQEALRDAVRRWRRPLVARAVTTVYDAYLRSQGVSAGVADYAAAGALIAAALEACPIPPGEAGAPPWCG